MKRILKYICIIVLIAFAFWGSCMLKCEYLTARYAHEFDFESVTEENTMISRPEYFKILSYKEDFSKIYYIEKHFSAGHVLTFKKTNDQWTYDSWEQTVWSSLGGSADGNVWPYFWHSFKYR